MVRVLYMLHAGSLFQCILFLAIFADGQNVTQTTVAGTTTQIDCPIAGTYTLPLWRGPPGFTTYTQTGNSAFNPILAGRWSYNANNRSIQTILTALSDEGTYQCIMHFITGFMFLQVRKPPSSPVLSTNIGQIVQNKLLLTEDQQVRLTCTSRGGNPAPSINLYRNTASGSSVAGSTSTSPVTEADGTFTVTINYDITVRRNDDRVDFICRSAFPTEPLNIQDTMVKLLLYLKPSTPNIYTVGSPTSGENNQQIARCETSGFRPSAINMTMLFRGKSSTSTTTVEDTGTETYNITSFYSKAVQKEDNGQPITCSVTHQTLAAPLSQAVSISVQFAPTSVSLTGNISVISSGNNKVTLTCTTGSANPASSITWTFDGNIIISNKQVLNNAGDYNGRVVSQELELTPTRDDDGKTIVCAASNTINNPVSSGIRALDLQFTPIATVSGPIQPVTETDRSVVLNCSAHSKPAPTFTWYHNNSPVSSGSTVTNNVNLYVIDTVNRADSGIYTCRASNGIGQFSEATLELAVRFAPDVTVKTQNVNINDTHANVVCSPSGVPSIYAYQPWTQAWISNGRVIQIERELGNSPTLTLTDLSYQHSGVYTCRVSNGVTESIHTHAGQGDVHLNVKSFPIITDPLVSGGYYYKMTIRLGIPTNISVQFYNNGDNADVSFYKLNSDTSQQNTYVHSISTTSVDVQLPVFKQAVITPGTMATVTMNVTQQQEFGLYAIVITNDIGKGVLPIEIIQGEAASVPEQLIVYTIHHTDVIISWERGFNGGFVQTFVIQLSNDNILWWDKTHVYDGLATSRKYINATVDDLSPGTLYYVRMFSYNQEGMSNYTVAINFTTLIATGDVALGSQSSTAAVVGGVVAGVAVIVLVVLAVMFVRKYQLEIACKCLCKFKKKNDPLSRGHNITSDVSSPVHSSTELECGPFDEVYLNPERNDQVSYYNTVDTSDPSSQYTTLGVRDTTASNYDSLHNIELEETQPCRTIYENLKV